MTQQPERRPLKPGTDVRNSRTGETGWVALDLGEHVSVWVGIGPARSLLWKREEVEVL